MCCLLLAFGEHDKIYKDGEKKLWMKNYFEQR